MDSGNKSTHVDAVGAELLQARLQRLGHLIGGMGTRLRGVLNLGRQREAPFLPLGLTREGFLLLANIDTRRIDLVIAAGLEHIEGLVVRLEVSDARAVGLAGPKGHQSEDDAVRGVACDQRHGGGIVS